MLQNQQISKTPEALILQGFDLLHGEVAKAAPKVFWTPKLGEFARLGFEEEPNVMYWIQWKRWFTTVDGWHHIPAPVIERTVGGFRVNLCMLQVAEGALASRVLPVLLSDAERRVARALIELAWENCQHQTKRGKTKMTPRGLAIPGVNIKPLEGHVAQWKVFVCAMWGQWIAGNVKWEARAADVREKFPVLGMTKNTLRRECYRMGLMGKA